MQRNQHSSQEELVLLLQGQSKTVDDGTKNLEKLSNSVETLSFIDELEEDVVYRATNVRSKI